MTPELIGQGLFALCMAACLVLLLRMPANKYGLIDHPCTRKQHHGTVPLVGGLAMCLAFCFAVFVLDSGDASRFAFLLLGGFTLMVAGLLDDLQEISVTLRFTLQIGAVLIVAVAGDVSLHNLGNLFATGDVTLGVAAIPFTIFAVVGILNAMNMADGLDGLAGGLAVVALVYFGLAASGSGMTSELTLLVLLIGCVAGFLVFNLRSPLRSKASVFMGDSGSMFLGFVLAWFAIHLSQGPVQAVSPIAAVWILGLPILDTIYAMLSRMFRGESPFSSGRDHLHYLLVDAGISVKNTVWILLAVSAVLGGIGMLGNALHWGESALFYLFLLLAGVYSVVRFSIERMAARRRLVRPA